MTDTTGSRRTRDVARSESLRERRVAMLRRTGLAKDYGIPLGDPSAAFWFILAIVMSFILLGLVMVLSSSSVVNINSGDSAWVYLQRQALWAVLGSAAMWGAYKLPYAAWGQQRLLAVLVGVLLAANAVVFLRGTVVNGARAWLDIGGYQIQPSEFLKVATVLFCANFLAARHRSVQIPQVVLWPMSVAMAVTAGLCMLQKDFGGAVIFVGIILAMMWVAGIPLVHLVPTMLVIGVGSALVLTQAGNASRRMFAFLNLEESKEDAGYQVYQAILSIANGGVTGTGIGSGTSKWGYVPLAHSDFIFSVIAEELGLLGSVIVIGGFLLLVLFGVQVALRAPDKHGALIAGGVSAWFAVQAVVNIGGVIGAIPMTGLTLPFLSYGGSSLLACMTAAGLLLNVARRMKV